MLELDVKYLKDLRKKNKELPFQQEKKKEKEKENWKGGKTGTKS